MTQGEALRIRYFWDFRGRPLCEHPVAALEETEKSYLTGRYICTTCGLIFERESCPQPSTPQGGSVPTPAALR